MSERRETEGGRARLSPEHREEIRRVVRDETAGARAREEPPTAPIADPAPLGLGAFALTTFVLSWVNAGLFDGAGVFIPLAFFYGGLAQLIAGIWEFRNNNTFGSTAFCSYGTFWLALAFFFFFTKQIGITTATEGTAVGLTLLAWTIFTAYMTIGAFRANLALGVTFVVLLVVFAMLSYGNAFGAAGVVKVAGYLGILLALMAWYISAAGVLNSVFGRTVLPVGAPRETPPRDEAASSRNA